MKNMLFILSVASAMLAMTACQNNGNLKSDSMNPERQEREFLRDAIRHRSPDVQRVDIVDSTLVYTHIYDGIIDVKTYTFDGDVCVGAERVFTFPTQMSALRHYRDAVEKAELYDGIEMFNNQVKYKLKDAQHRVESKGLTKEQMKAKFDKQISDAKADMKRHDEKMKADMKSAGCCIEKDIDAMGGKMKEHHDRHRDRK